jgi:hypothetical protein
MLKRHLVVSHSGGHIQTRNCSEQYVYLKCTICHKMMCAAGSKKISPTQWHVTSISSFALEPCKGYSVSMSPALSAGHSVSMSPANSIPPLAIPSLVAPSVQNPVANFPDFPEGPEVECVGCWDMFRRTTQCPQGHAWCITCFSSTVALQCNPTDDHLGIQKFLEKRGVVCTVCPPAIHRNTWTFDLEKLSVW